MEQPQPPRLRCACVTGSNRGIGYDICRRLLILGDWQVVLACRSLTKGESAKQALVQELEGSIPTVASRTHVVELDLLHDEMTLQRAASKIRSAVATTNSDNGCLDVLIHNAAYITYDHVSPETVGTSMEVNYGGTVRVNQALMPLVKRPGGRVIFVSSAVGKTYLVPPETQAQLLSESLTEKQLSTIVEELEQSVQEGRYQEPTNHVGGLAYGLGKLAGTTIYPRILAEQQPASDLFIASCCPAFGGADTPVFLATAPFDNALQVGHGAFWEQRQITNPSDWQAGMKLG